MSDNAFLFGTSLHTGQTLNENQLENRTNDFAQVTKKQSHLHHKFPVLHKVLRETCSAAVECKTENESRNFIRVSNGFTHTARLSCINTLQSGVT